MSLVKITSVLLLLGLIARIEAKPKSNFLLVEKKGGKKLLVETEGKEPEVEADVELDVGRRNSGNSSLAEGRRSCPCHHQCCYLQCPCYDCCHIVTRYTIQRPQPTRPTWPTWCPTCPPQGTPPTPPTPPTTTYKPYVKPVLIIYYESYCYAARQFIKEVWAAYCIARRWFRVKFVAYGRAKTLGDWTSGYYIVCPGGKKECTANTIQACTVKYIREEYKQVSLMNCMAKHSQPHLAGLSCFQSHHLEYTRVEKCAGTYEGFCELFKNGQMTQRLRPPLCIVPWITWNGKGDQYTYYETRELTIIGYLCKYFYHPSMPSHFCYRVGGGGPRPGGPSITLWQGQTQTQTQWQYQRPMGEGGEGGGKQACSGEFIPEEDAEAENSKQKCAKAA